MKSKSFNLSLLTSAVLLSVSTSCSDSQAVSEVANSNDASEASSVVEAAESTPPAKVAQYQLDLLKLAYDAASAFPKSPHLKNRSRAQEAVVLECIELDHPELALTYTSGIDNWRKGLCYATVARYYAEHGGEKKDIERYLSDAAQISKTDVGQQWRADRIKMRIAQARYLLGQHEEAAKLEQFVDPSEEGKLEVYRAKEMTDEEVDARLQALNDLIDRGTLEQVQATLDVCTSLFDRYYDDLTRRQLIYSKMQSAWPKIPLAIRFATVASLTEVSLDHDDQEFALKLIEDLKTAFAAGTWLPENEVPMVAKLGSLRMLAGDEEGAPQLESAFTKFEAQLAFLPDHRRTRVLLPVAEANVAVERMDVAGKLYKRALRESVSNPNARPRANDLIAICCSLARHEIEPDELLWTHLRESFGSLKDPW